MEADRPVLQVIVGSTRPGRVGRPVATWFAEVARASGQFEVEVVDLKEVDLPIYDEPKHPRLGQYEHEHTRRWSETVARGDAYVFVIPEYNYGLNAATKNAIDYLHQEWKFKPFAAVSYGGIGGGTRALQMLKQVLTTLNMVAIFEAVNIPFVAQHVSDGVFTPPEGTAEAAGTVLDALAAWVPATRLRRDA